MNYKLKNSAFLMMAVLLVVSCVGCGGSKPGAGSASVGGGSSVSLSEASSYDSGVMFAAPKGWKEAKRQGKIVVKFDNPDQDGQSVFVKNPESAEIETLATPEDAQKSGLKGDMVQAGKYMWMKREQRSKDPKTEDKFDNLICTTIQFGKAYTVTVRGFENENPNADGIMNAVLSAVEFAKETEAEPEVIDENTDFNVDL